MEPSFNEAFVSFHLAFSRETLVGQLDGGAWEEFPQQTPELLFRARGGGGGGGGVLMGRV